MEPEELDRIGDALRKTDPTPGPGQWARRRGNLAARLHPAGQRPLGAWFIRIAAALIVSVGIWTLLPFDSPRKPATPPSAVLQSKHPAAPWLGAVGALAEIPPRIVDSTLKAADPSTLFSQCRKRVERPFRKRLDGTVEAIRSQFSMVDGLQSF